MNLFEKCLVLGGPVLLAFSCAGGLFGADTGYKLTSTMSLAAVSMPSSGNWEWSHGAFVVVEMIDPLVKSFTVLDRDGSASFYDFSIPDTTHIWVHGFDRDYAGNLVFAGRATSSEGRYAPFIAIKPRDGSETRLIRTYPYWPVLLCVAPDGSIWTTGEEMTPEGKSSGPGVNPNGDVVRHFDQSGRLIGSAVPRQTVLPGWRSAQGYLVATTRQIGWYSPVRGQGAYVELDPSLDGYKVYKGVPDEKGQAAGFALTDSGKVFVTHYTPNKQATYALDRASNQWTEVPLPDSSLVAAGSEKETIVFKGLKGLLFFDPLQSLSNR